MKPNTGYGLSLLLSGCLITAPSAAQQAAPKRPPATPSTKTTAPQEVIAELHPSVKVVRYSAQDVIRIKTKLRYTTLIILPKSETILDFTCGDKDYWVVNGAQNFAYVKPAKTGAQTNLNLVTASGNIYSFLLVEVSESPPGEPDMKVFVEVKEESMISSATGVPRFVSLQQVDECRAQVELAKAETQKVKLETQAAIDRGINRFLANVRFPYRFEAGKKPFFVRAIYHDDKSTYVLARPEEVPALYEIKDGKPNLVNFKYQNGMYVVDKILDQGYLAIGKKKLAFRSQE